MSQTLKTDSLELIPHTPAALLALIEGLKQYEQVSGLRAAKGMHEFMVSPDVSPAWLAELRKATAADPWMYGYAVVHSGEGLVIGSASFKGPPTEGAVELAYGIVPSHRNQGFATEAAQALIAYAVADRRVQVIRARTAPETNASTRVLSKCRLVHVGEVIDPEDGRVWCWEYVP